MSLLVVRTSRSKGNVMKFGLVLRLARWLAFGFVGVLVVGCSTTLADYGNVRVVQTTSCGGMCGTTTDQSVVSNSGRTLVPYLNTYEMSPDGKWMVAIAWTGKPQAYSLHVIDLARKEVALSVDLAGENHEVGSWSPDGSKILIWAKQYLPHGATMSLEYDSTVYVLSQQGAPALRPIFHEPGQGAIRLRGNEWSPDGKAVAFIATSGGHSDGGSRVLEVSLKEPCALREVGLSRVRPALMHVDWVEGRAQLIGPPR